MSRPITLAEVNPAPPAEPLYKSADDPFCGGLYHAVERRGALRVVYGNPVPDWAEVDTFNDRYRGAPVGFVIEQVNRIIEHSEGFDKWP